jgi:hypothetical protein
VRVLGKRGGLILLCAWHLSANAFGQSLFRKDSTYICTLPGPADTAIPPIFYRLEQDIEYSLSFANLLFINWKQGNNNNFVSLAHHLKYRSQFTNPGNIKISNSFTHDLGIQYFFDSISRFQPDENTLDTRVEVGIRKNLTLSVLSNLSTRIFNSYFYASNRQGNLVKTLSGAFLTPFLWTFSTGFGLTIPRLGSVNLGISAARLTWIRNNDVYDQQNILEFYGVPKKKQVLLEYGLSMHLLVDRKFLTRVHWNCDLLVFKNYKKPFDFTMKNFVSVRISKFLKTSIQTRVYYENEVSKQLQVENLVSLGCYFNL